MAITRVQGNARVAVRGSTTFAITMASTPTQGNLLILATGIVYTTANKAISSISQTNVTWTKQASVYYASNYGSVEIWAGVGTQ